MQINKDLLPELNYCWASMSSDYTIKTIKAVEQLPINSQVRSNGNKLSVTSDGIKIGAGVNNVLISGQIYWYTNCSGSEGVLYIYKNNQLMTANSHRITDDYEHQASATITIPVAEGDIINLRVINNHKTALIKNYPTGTFLIVTVLN